MSADVFAFHHERLPLIDQYLNSFKDIRRRKWCGKEVDTTINRSLDGHTICIPDHEGYRNKRICSQITVTDAFDHRENITAGYSRVRDDQIRRNNSRRRYFPCFKVRKLTHAPQFGAAKSVKQQSAHFRLSITQKDNDVIKLITSRLLKHAFPCHTCGNCSKYRA